MTLAEFLAKEGVIYKFLKNISSFYDEGTVVSIISAFGWGDVPEGVNFWRNLADKTRTLDIYPQRISEIKEYAKQFKKSFKEIQ